MRTRLNCRPAGRSRSGRRPPVHRPTRPTARAPGGGRPFARPRASCSPRSRRHRSGGWARPDRGGHARPIEDPSAACRSIGGGVTGRSSPRCRYAGCSCRASSAHSQRRPAAIDGHFGSAHGRGTRALCRGLAERSDGRCHRRQLRPSGRPVPWRGYAGGVGELMSVGLFGGKLDGAAFGRADPQGRPPSGMGRGCVCGSAFLDAAIGCGYRVPPDAHSFGHPLAVLDTGTGDLADPPRAEGMTGAVIVGAGPLGRAIAARIVEDGGQVRVLTRDGRDIGPGIAPVRAELSDEAAVIAACDGAETIYQCAAPPYHQWPTLFHAFRQTRSPRARGPARCLWRRKTSAAKASPASCMRGCRCERQREKADFARGCQRISWRPMLPARHASWPAARATAGRA